MRNLDHLSLKLQTHLRSPRHQSVAQRYHRQRNFGNGMDPQMILWESPRNMRKFSSHARACKFIGNRDLQARHDKPSSYDGKKRNFERRKRTIWPNGLDPQRRKTRSADNT
ncbi:hypothetical protein BV898_08361 [Hypsibius exemplaris]|uniref:Uncharacterized protein n=1 Tax=Hypsibius exemplaris TaxID=2072580 RepID=A0A1W0WQW1_HYPEX|nr:hypothetical protein BV898_08361 [Hypsibius exemplaris]